MSDNPWTTPQPEPGQDGAHSSPEAEASPFTPGGNFIFDASADPVPIWGHGSDVLHAEGGTLIIAAPPGLGKTTLAQQHALGRCGFAGFDSLLGYPIKAGNKTVLYLAMDRPRQIARSFHRMVDPAMREELNRRLVVWQGPPPEDLAQHTGMLLSLCLRAGADTVYVDSVKDAALGLSDDEVGAGYNRARQKALTAGIEIVECHHTRKKTNGQGQGPPTLDDLYGATWIGAGSDSVLMLEGAAGDPIVTAHHVKQPAADVGPLRVLHDHDRGRSTLAEQFDLLATMQIQVNGVTALDMARVKYEADSPTPAQKEKVRRELDRLVSNGLARVIDEGDRGTKTPKRWGSV